MDSSVSVASGGLLLKTFSDEVSGEVRFGNSIGSPHALSRAVQRHFHQLLEKHSIPRTR